VLERLKVTASARLPQGLEFSIALVTDGTVLVERTLHFTSPPRLVTARPDSKVDETQALRSAAFTNSPVGSAPVATDPPHRKGRPRAASKEVRAEAERLVSRGERHLADGNITIARQYFLRASELGLAIAALKMAETHDARALGGINVRGLMPDPAEAKKWYERALELGAPEAEARLQRLGSK
jgi:TPR repeat protein